MKHRFFLLFSFFLLTISACNKKENQITGLKMLEGGKTFAVPTGTIADQFVLKKFPDARIKYYNSALDCAIAVKDGKADAACYDQPILKNIAAKNEGVTVLPELLLEDRYGFAVQLGNHRLKSAIDSVLSTLNADGTYDEMMKRWFPAKGNPAPMPLFQFNNGNGVLRFGTAAVTEPMSFYDSNHKIAGFDIELATRIAHFLGKKIEIVDMDFGAMLPALISGKVDMIGAGLSITEERAKKVLYSESYYPSGIAALVRSKSDRENEMVTPKLRSGKEICDKRIGVMLGTVHDSYARKNYPNAEIFQYHSVPDMIMALNSGKVDVAIIGNVTLKDILKRNDRIGILENEIYSCPLGIGFNKENTALISRFNAFLKEIKANGIYDDMVDRWMKKDIYQMPQIETPAKNGKLNSGVVTSIGFPHSGIENGKNAGFDIELAKRFAAYLGMEFVPVDLVFSSMLASLKTNKIDIAACSMMITGERQKQISFSDPYYSSVACIIALKNNMSAFTGNEEKPVKASFAKSISESFYNNIILEKRYLLIIDGLKITILISIFASIVGTIIGGLVCFMRMSRRKILSMTARFYISILRGTPVLVLLMIIYYVVFGSVNINPAIVAIFAFGLNFGAYVSEMFRTSIESVDKGQKEAGIAGGFTQMQTFIHIILPQATRQALPVYKGEFISLVKMTSIVGYIAVQDLTKASDIIRSRTFDAFFPLLMAALLYLIIAWLLSWALGYVEVSVDPKRRHLTIK